MAGENVDWSFLKEAEDTQAVGYVPHDGAGPRHSGTTMETGFDRCGITKRDVGSLSVSQRIKGKLHASLGTTRRIAIIDPDIKNLGKGIDQPNGSLDGSEALRSAMARPSSPVAREGSSDLGLGARLR